MKFFWNNAAFILIPLLSLTGSALAQPGYSLVSPDKRIEVTREPPYSRFRHAGFSSPRRPVDGPCGWCWRERRSRGRLRHRFQRGVSRVACRRLSDVYADEPHARPPPRPRPDSPPRPPSPPRRRWKPGPRSWRSGSWRSCSSSSSCCRGRGERDPRLHDGAWAIRSTPPWRRAWTSGSSAPAPSPKQAGRYADSLAVIEQVSPLRRRSPPGGSMNTYQPGTLEQRFWRNVDTTSGLDVLALARPHRHQLQRPQLPRSVRKAHRIAQRPDGRGSTGRQACFALL